MTDKPTPEEFTDALRLHRDWFPGWVTEDTPSVRAIANSLHAHATEAVKAEAQAWLDAIGMPYLSNHRVKAVGEAIHLAVKTATEELEATVKVYRESNNRHIDYLHDMSIKLDGEREARERAENNFLNVSLERDQLKAEVEGLKANPQCTGCNVLLTCNGSHREHPYKISEENARLKAEVEELKATGIEALNRYEAELTILRKREESK